MLYLKCCIVFVFIKYENRPIEGVKQPKLFPGSGGMLQEFVGVKIGLNAENLGTTLAQGLRHQLGLPVG